MVAAFAVCTPIVAHGQPLTVEYWQGNTWNQNVNRGAWFPAVSENTATFVRSDTQWGQIRTLSNYVGSVRATFEVNPLLQSGETHGDEALFGFGQHWWFYHDNPVGEWVPGPGPVAVGVKLAGGNIYIIDGIGTGADQAVLVGTYTPGQWVQMTLDLSASGYLQVAGAGVSASYQTTNLQSSVKFIAANSGSTDGFQLRGVSVVSRSLPVELAAADWIGNTWSRNVNQGAWFPDVADGIATFVSDDYSWGQIRTINTFTGSVSATLEIRPMLTTGGVNGDAAFIGFGQHWCLYHENPVGQWVPGPGPATVGLWFQDGKIYIADGIGTQAQLLSHIGAYTPGQWLPVTLDLNARGVIRISAPGMNATYTTPNPQEFYKFIIAEANSGDGIQVRNVTLGAGGNILTAVASALYHGLFVQDGLPGQTYQILSSPSLTPPMTWTPVAVFTQNPGGFHWVDTTSPANLPAKYYKVVPNP